MQLGAEVSRVAGVESNRPLSRQPGGARPRPRPGPLSPPHPPSSLPLSAQATRPAARLGRHMGNARPAATTQDSRGSPAVPAPPLGKISCEASSSTSPARGSLPPAAISTPRQTFPRPEPPAQAGSTLAPEARKRGSRPRKGRGRRGLGGRARNGGWWEWRGPLESTTQVGRWRCGAFWGQRGSLCRAWWVWSFELSEPRLPHL